MNQHLIMQLHNDARIAAFSLFVIAVCQLIKLFKD